jgi:hypothetical protein
MRSIWVLALLMFPVSALSDAMSELPGLGEAVLAHQAGFHSRDNAQLSATVTFPHVQFYPDGRTVVYASESDLPDMSEAQMLWKVDEMTLLSKGDGVAVVRVTFVSTGDNAGESLGAGLWSFLEQDGQWRVLWRQFLGPVEGDAA